MATERETRLRRASCAVVLSGFVDEVLNAAAILAAVDLPAKEKEPTPADRLQATEARLHALEEKVRALETKEPGKG